MPRDNLSQYEEGALLGGMKPRRMQPMSKEPMRKGKVPMRRRMDAAMGGRKDTRSMQRFK